MASEVSCGFRLQAQDHLSIVNPTLSRLSRRRGAVFASAAAAISNVIAGNPALFPSWKKQSLIFTTS
jgi:hypothetical protein